MGIFGALNTAVNGLQSQSFALQNISGNIANSQTIAYKAIGTTFVDLIPDAVVGRQVAGNVAANSVSTNDVQGAIQNASVSTYMAINGDGFFAVKQPTGTSGGKPLFANGDLYTRRGDFQMDQNGYLVNGAGYYLEGIPINLQTGNPTGSALAPIQFNNAFLPATATTTITYGANLPSYPQTSLSSPGTPQSELLKAADFGTDPTTAGTGTVVGSDVTTFLNESLDGGAVTAYDSAGQPANVQFRWAKTDAAAYGGTDTWQLFYQTNSAATGAQVAWINAGTDFKFNASGALNPPISQVSLTGVTVDGTLLGNLKVQLNGLTQFATSGGAVTVNSLQQDGYPSGQLQSISIGKNGRISGSFTNGKNVDLAEIPLMSFASPNNLKSLDGGAFAITGSSGPALAGAPGHLVGSSLEGSNADIADQFTKLIVTQQAYSANTRVVTTANQMSQDMLNMLR
ncbi:MAG TPA: flagellar hook-basal body complex protein [Pseudolabrys sp.]|nr:flagellar hook-basal body complex protein [Pseudolabrys sp.]